MSYSFRAKLANDKVAKFQSAHSDFGNALTEFAKTLSGNADIGSDGFTAIVSMTAKRRESKSSLTIADAPAAKPRKDKKKK